MKLFNRVELIMGEIEEHKRNRSNIFNPTQQLKNNYSKFRKDLVKAVKDNDRIKDAVALLPNRVRSAYVILVVTFSLLLSIGLPAFIYFISHDWKLYEVGFYSFLMVGLLWSIFIFSIEVIRKKQTKFVHNLFLIREMLRKDRI